MKSEQKKAHAAKSSATKNRTRSVSNPIAKKSTKKAAAGSTKAVRKGVVSSGASKPPKDSSTQSAKTLQGTKLAQLLLTFDTERIDRFRLYVHSPYFNTSETISTCCDSFTRYYPDFSQHSCTLEHIHSEVFPSKEFDYHRINNVLSDLYEVALNFLIQISRDGQDHMERWRILPRLRQAGLDKQFAQQMKKYEKMLEQDDNEDFTHIYRAHFINEQIWQSSAVAPENRYGLLEQQYAAILNFVLIRLGRLATIMYFEQYQSSVRFDLPFADQLIAFFKTDRVPNHPVVQLYKHAILLITAHKDADYFALRELGRQHASYYGSGEMGFINIFTSHHVIRCVNEEERDDLLPYLIEDERRHLIASQYLLQPRFPFADFVRAIRIACMANDLEWAEELQSVHLERVVPDEYENCAAFATAMIARTKGQRREALAAIQQVNFRLPILAIQVKNLSIQLLYELASYEQCLLAVDSYRHYLKSQQALPESYITTHQHFISHTKRLITVASKLRSKTRTEEARALRASIDAIPTNTFNLRRWLRQRVDELIG